MAEKLMVSVNEACDRTGIGRSALYEMIRDGEIQSVKVGRRRLIPVTGLESLVERLIAESNPAA